MTKWH